MTLWRGNLPELGNVLASTIYLQYLTWILQVMPLFFIAGGAASFLSWQSAQRKRITFTEWIWKRLTRLLSPVFFYLSIMAPIGGIVSRLVDPTMATPLLNLTTQLLWFLGVYLVITALTPILVKLHERIGRKQLFLWLLVVITADFVRLYANGPAAIGLINFVAVWAIASMLGIWYLTLQHSRIQLWLIAVSSVAINIALVYFGPYPVSLVGMPNESFSNMAPPSSVMAFQSIAMWAAVQLLKSRIASFAQRAQIWRATVAVNLSAMTIYLWHLPTLILVTVIAHLTNFSPAIDVNNGVLMPASDYWSRAVPLWIVTWLLVYGLVQVLWFSEHLDWPFFAIRNAITTARWRSWLASLGVSTIGVGMLLLSASGLSEFPTRVTEFAGLRWSSGFAVGVVLVGTIFVKSATALGLRANQAK